MNMNVNQRQITIGGGDYGLEGVKVALIPSVRAPGSVGWGLGVALMPSIQASTFTLPKLLGRAESHLDTCTIIVVLCFIVYTWLLHK